MNAIKKEKQKKKALNVLEKRWSGRGSRKEPTAILDKMS
jgi:hypothetical protein